jgi:hypothetical protein
MNRGVAQAPAETTDYQHITLTKPGSDIDQCPCCKKGKMLRLLNCFSEYASDIA